MRVVDSVASDAPIPDPLDAKSPGTPMPEPRGADSLRRWQYRIFAVSWLTYAGYYLGRVNLAVAVPVLGAHYGWPKTSLGLLGSVFFWVYAFSQLINGHIGERVSARRFVALGLGLSGLLNLVFGSLGVFPLMLAVWALNGWAQATGWGPIMKTLSKWFSTEQRGRLTALFSPCYVGGHALSWLLAGFLVGAWGWRYAFWVPGVILLILAMFWYLLSRDGPGAIDPSHSRPVADPEQQRERIAPLQGLRDMFARPKLRSALVVCFLSGMIKDGLSLWGPTLLVEQLGLPVATAALTGTIIPISGAFGAMTAGWALHRVRGRQEMPVVAILACLVVLATLGLYLVGAMGLVWLALVVLGAMALGSHGMNALLMASLPLSLGSEGKVSTAAGTLDFSSYLGAGLSAILVGWLLDVVGWSAVYGWWVAVAVVIVIVSLGQARASRSRSTANQGM